MFLMNEKKQLKQLWNLHVLKSQGVDFIGASHKFVCRYHTFELSFPYKVVEFAQ